MPNLPLPAGVMAACERLRAHGHSAYIAGGAVRDLATGLKNPEDWDIATSARPEEVMAFFERAYPTGIAHGTVTVKVSDQPIEITTFRTEGPYSDGRHPDYVGFADSIYDDLGRRDFTINAMAYDPFTNEIIDPYGGLRDIDEEIIRTVGDPASRFSEDRLRMLRAVRFAATLGYAIQPDAFNEICERAHLLVHVSRERIAHEMGKTLAASRPSYGLTLLRDTGLMGYVLPGICDADGSRWASALKACDLVGPGLDLRLACLILALGAEGPKWSSSVAETLKELRFSGCLADRVQLMVRFCRIDPAGDSDYALRKYASCIGRANVMSVLAVRAAVEEASCRQPMAWMERVKSIANDPVPLSVAELPVGGADIMAVTHLSPGPKVRQVLTSLLHLVWKDQSLNNRDALMSIASSLVKTRGVDVNEV